MKLPVNPRALVGKVLTSKGFRDAVLVYFAYCFRFISPLLLYPLLTRRLGVDGFALYASAYSIALLLSVVVEYGFNLSGTRDIAATTSQEERGRITIRVVFAKLLLIPIGVAIGVALGLTSPVTRDNWPVIALAILLGCGQGMSAFWYFQGVRRILIAVALEVGSQLAALLLTFFIVQRSSDVILALSLQAAFAWLAAILGSLIMLRAHPIGILPSLKETFSALVGGFPVFISRSAVMIYSSAGVFLLGVTSTAGQAAWYGASERITAPAAAMLRPLSTLVLPVIAGKANSDPKGVVKLVSAIAAGFATVYGAAALVIAATSGWLFPIVFGKTFAGGAPVLAVLALTMPLMALNNIISNQLLISFKLDRYMAIIVVGAAAVNLATAIPLGAAFGGVGMASARLISEAFMLCLSVFIAWRKIGPLVRLGQSARQRAD